MHSYTVHKNGSNLGPLSADEVRSKLASGEFSPADLAWRPGVPAWMPLGQRLAEDAGSAPPPIPASGAPGVYAAPPKKSNTALIIVAVLGVCLIGGVVVIGILAALAIPAFTKVRNTAIEKSMLNDARQISSAWNQSCSEQGKESASIGEIRAMVPTLSQTVVLSVETKTGKLRPVDFAGGDDKLRLTKGERFILIHPQYKRALSSNREIAGRDGPEADAIAFDLETGRIDD